MTSTLPDPSSPDAFLRWERTLAALEDAEARGDSHADLVALSEDVIRAHNDVTEDAAGAKDIRLHLSDELLLIERDDTSGPTVFSTSSNP